MKVKLDDYEVRVLINGLIQQHRSYDAETNGQIDALALRLCDIAEAMKPGRKKKIPFEPVEKTAGERIRRWRIRRPKGKRAGMTIIPTPKARFDHWFVKMLSGV